MSDFTVERFGDCIRVNVPCARRREWEFWCLLTSDRHWDNPKSDHAMQRRHLDQVKERGGAWLDCGDLFCAMQGKYDKRASKSDVRPEHQNEKYLDSLVSTAVEWFAPYSKRCIFLSHGNHEASIAKRCETDLCERLIGGLNLTTQSNVLRGGFANWTVFRFAFEGKTDGARNVTLYTDHGWGGGGPVTLDMIQHQRRAAFIDADVVATGHTHDSWTAERIKLRVDQQGAIKRKTQLHLKLPTYKDDYGVGKGGWHAETGKPPKPMGAWWLKFTYDPTADEVKYEPVRAA